MMSEVVPIKPYARLLTMLGDQLIKNESIALTELIKNAYDADAEWVKISFENVGEDYSINKDSKIIIEDDGVGMNEEVIKKHWLNPATPYKKLKTEQKEKTKKGRVLQGEKGIGRFAIFKLGNKIKITTKAENENIENTVEYDFSKYDKDFLEEDGVQKELFLEDLKVYFAQQKPKEIIKKDIRLDVTISQRPEKGTKIEISGLKGDWTQNKIKNIRDDIEKMQPIFDLGIEKDFKVYVEKNNKNDHETLPKYKTELIELLDTKSVFRIKEGHYIQEKKEIKFTIDGYGKNNTKVSVPFSDNKFSNLKYFTKNFDNEYKTQCGNFQFEFYIFDFAADKESKYYLSPKGQKSQIKNHRTYLYRDNIRVLPYGDPEDDWLGIDISRGTDKAGSLFSNDQLIGCIFITKENNKNLIDKTNREGLIQEGKATSDFTALLQCILAYIHTYYYSIYKIDKERIKKAKNSKIQKTQTMFTDFLDNKEIDEKTKDSVKKIEDSYKIEKEQLNNKIEKVENLAAVGLSVETASHDIILSIGQLIDTVHNTSNSLKTGKNIDQNVLRTDIERVEFSAMFIERQLRSMQSLFPSARSRAKDIKLKEILLKVKDVYNHSLEKNEIDVQIISIDPPLIVKTTDAVLLQVFINLFDNSIYWLQKEKKDKKMEIILDGEKRKVIFSDNGPGIADEIKDYVFESFFSGKGESGRGLGLYIAQQLLDRYDYSIKLAELKNEKRLDGANFILDFNQQE